MIFANPGARGGIEWKNVPQETWQRETLLRATTSPETVETSPPAQANTQSLRTRAVYCEHGDQSSR